MKKVRGFASMLVVLGVIMMGVSNASAGMLMSDFMSTQEPCTEQRDKTKDINVDHGIIVHDLIDWGSGIIDSLFGKSDGEINCGIIVHD